MREAISRARTGDTILALPDARPELARLPEGVQLVTIAEAITHGVGVARWAIDLYRSLS